MSPLLPARRARRCRVKRAPSRPGVAHPRRVYVSPPEVVIMSEVEFGVVLPQVGAGWEQVVSFARRAEDGGFDSVWLIDHLLGFPAQAGILEAWTAISALAASTSRVGIGAQ